MEPKERRGCGTLIDTLILCYLALQTDFWTHCFISLVLVDRSVFQVFRQTTKSQDLVFDSRSSCRQEDIPASLASGSALFPLPTQQPNCLCLDSHGAHRQKQWLSCCAPWHPSEEPPSPIPDYTSTKKYPLSLYLSIKHNIVHVEIPKRQVVTPAEEYFNSKIDELDSESEGKQVKRKGFLLPCPLM